MPSVRRTTPAFWLALAALLVSMTGTGFAAAGLVTSKNIKDRTIKVKDLSPKTVDKLRGGTGPVGPIGPPGTGVRAFGVVDAGPSANFVGSRTSGLSTVTRPSVGVYCLTLTDTKINPATIAPIVAVDGAGSVGDSLFAMARTNLTGCPAGTDLAVRTFKFSAVAESILTDDANFVVLVP